MAAPLDLSRLPQDICDAVIEHLYADTHALRACAATSRAWRHTSQRLLFASISLADAASANALLDLLDTSPYLAPFVRRLRIDAGQGYLDRAPPWVTPALSGALVEQLSELENLTVEQLSWKSVRPHHRPGFLQFPSVTHLTLNYCYFPSFDGFADFLGLENERRLKRIELYYILWDGFMRTPGRASPGCPARCASVERRREGGSGGGKISLTLEELSLAFCQSEDVFDWLLDGPFDLRIRKLELAKFVPGDLKQAGVFLRRLGDSLEHLAFGLSNWDGDRHGEPLLRPYFQSVLESATVSSVGILAVFTKRCNDAGRAGSSFLWKRRSTFADAGYQLPDAVHEQLSLSHCTSLRTLDILELDTHARARPIGWVLNLIRSLPRRGLQELRVDLRAADCTAARECIDWPALARALPDGARLVLVLGPGVDAARVPACLGERMPRVKEKGLLEFEVPEPPPCSP